MIPIYDAHTGIFVSFRSFADKYKDNEELLDANNTCVTTDNLLNCALLAIDRVKELEVEWHKQIIDRQNWEMRAHTAEKVNKVLTRQLHEQRAWTLEAESRVRVR